VEDPLGGDAGHRGGTTTPPPATSDGIRARHTGQTTADFDIRVLHEGQRRALCAQRAGTSSGGPGGGGGGEVAGGTRGLGGAAGRSAAGGGGGGGSGDQARDGGTIRMTVAPQLGQKRVPSSAGFPQAGQGYTPPVKYIRYLTDDPIVRSRCVGLVTQDAALYADLASALRERHLPSVSLWPGERIPDRVAVVLTGPTEVNRISHPRVLAVQPDSDRASLWAAVQSALACEAPKGTGELVVGIDPGPRPGYAVLSEGRLLVEGVVESPEAVAELARTLGHRFPLRSLRFRIGSGDPPDRNRIVRALGPGKRLELVNEQGTTPRIARRHRDAAAARAIARLSGPTLSKAPALRATRGAITQIQRLSREASGGRFTISRALASRVHSGELTLGQAMDEGTERYVAPGSRSFSVSLFAHDQLS
jgi:hypothetical protein